MKNQLLISRLEKSFKKGEFEALRNVDLKEIRGGYSSQDRFDLDGCKKCKPNLGCNINKD